MAITVGSTGPVSSINVGGGAAISLNPEAETVAFPGGLVANTLHVSGLSPKGKPSYPCRAWINFSGHAVTSANTMLGVRGNANIASVLDLGVGQYRVYFSEAMSSTAAYVVTASGQYEFATSGSWMIRALASNYFQVENYSNGRLGDELYCLFAVFDY